MHAIIKPNTITRAIQAENLLLLLYFLPLLLLLLLLPPPNELSLSSVQDYQITAPSGM